MTKDRVKGKGNFNPWTKLMRAKMYVTNIWNFVLYLSAIWKKNDFLMFKKILLF